MKYPPSTQKLVSDEGDSCEGNATDRHPSQVLNQDLLDIHHVPLRFVSLRSPCVTHGFLFLPTLLRLISIVRAIVAYDQIDNLFKIRFIMLDGTPVPKAVFSVLRLGDAKLEFKAGLHRFIASGTLYSLVGDFFQACNSHGRTWGGKSLPTAGTRPTTMAFWFGSPNAIAASERWHRLITVNSRPFAERRDPVRRERRVKSSRSAKALRKQGFGRTYEPQAGITGLGFQISDSCAAVVSLMSDVRLAQATNDPMVNLVKAGVVFVIEMARVWTGVHTKTEILARGFDKIVETFVAQVPVVGEYVPQNGSHLLPLLLTALVFLPAQFLQEDPTQRVKSAIKFFKASSSWDSSLSVTQLVTSYLTWFFRVGTQCYTEKSLKPLFHTGESYLSWYSKARDLVERRHALGLHDQDYVAYFDQLSQHVCVGEDIVEKCAENRGVGLSIVLHELDKLKDLLREKELMDKVRTLRTEPFFLGLEGPPKIGKSVMTKLLHQVFMNLHPDLDYHPRQLFVKSFTDKYDSGLESHHSVYLIDDVGTVRSSVSGELALAPLLAIMEAANQATSASNQAELEKKGKVFPLPQLVLVTSNDPFYGAIGNLVTPQALWRRIRFSVCLKVKAAFATPEGHVDPALAAGHTHIHTFTVKKFTLPPTDSQPSAKGKFITIFEDVDYPVFWDWYTREVKSYFDLRARGLEQRKAQETAPPCCKCHLPETACICAPYDPQMFGAAGAALGRFAGKLTDHFEWPTTYAKRKVFELGQEFVTFGKDFLPEIASFVKSYDFAGYLRTLALGVGLSYLHHRSLPTAVTARSGELPPVFRLSDFHSTYKPQVGYDEWRASIQTATGSNFYAPKPDTLRLTDQARALPFPDAWRRIQHNIKVLICGDLFVHALGIKGDIFITVRHFVQHVLDNPTEEFSYKELERGALSHPLTLRHQDVLNCGTRDLAFLRLDRLGCKDISWLLPVDPLREGVSFPASTLMGAADGLDVTTVPVSCEREGPPERRTMLGYFADTQAGFCGLPILARTNTNVPVLLGIHAYGMPGEGVTHSLGEPFCAADVPSVADWQERLLEVPPELKLESNGLQLEADRPVRLGEYTRHSAYTWRKDEFGHPVVPLGTIEFPARRLTTAYAENPLWEFIRSAPDCGRILPELRPQRVGDKFICYETEGLLEYKERPNTFTRDELEGPFEWLTNHYLAIIGGRKGHPLSEEDSLNGIDGAEFMYAFNRKTGCGLPHRGPKAVFLEGDPEKGDVRYTARARKSVKFVARAYSKGVNPGIIADCCLKDEPKKPGKNVRLFAVLPFQHNDITRRGLLSIFRILQLHFLDSFCSIGVRADSEQWKAIERVHKMFRFHLDIDFKTFDKSHNKWIKFFVFKLFFRLMKKYFHEYDKIAGHPWAAVMTGAFRVSMSLLFYSNTTLYQIFTGLASGETITAWFNSVAQLLMLICACFEHQERYGVWPRFYVSVYGDDGILSTDTETFDFFFLQDFFSRHSMVVTPGTKDSVPTSFVPWEEISYLKRTFRRVGRNVFAPLALPSISKQLQWWKPSVFETEESQLRMCVENVGLYASAHPVGLADQVYAEACSAFEARFPAAISLNPLKPLSYFREKLLAEVEKPLTYPAFRTGEPLSLEEKLTELRTRVRKAAR